jgi:hypothetical protein
MSVVPIRQGRTEEPEALLALAITGISTTFSGLTGCFYMLQEGVPTAFTAERSEGKADASGRS